MNGNRIKIPKKILIPVIAVIAVFLIIQLYMIFGTASGRRNLKTIRSDWTGGIERTVTVYDINGNVIKVYEGKFDITYDDDRIMFDDEDGKRHQIYYTTGTVIIDEN